MMRRRGGLDGHGPGPVERPARFGAVATVAMVLFGAVAVALTTSLLATSLLAPDQRDLFSDVALIPVAATIPVCCRHPARRTTGQIRLAWSLLGLAGLLWTLGEAAWLVTHHLASVERDPSAADVFYLAGDAARVSRRGRFGAVHRPHGDEPGVDDRGRPVGAASP